jgi:hypothetical protein
VFLLSNPIAAKTNTYLQSFYVADMNVAATTSRSVGAFNNTTFDFSRYFFFHFSKCFDRGPLSASKIQGVP